MTSIQGYDYKTNNYINIELAEGKISEIQTRNDIPLEKRATQTLIPGFFDLQINGYGGYDFNDINTTPEDVLKVTQLLNGKGTLQFLPTVITNSKDNISTLVKTIAEAVDKYEVCKNSIVGIHLEGPFLSKEDGPRGAHPLADICEPNIESIAQWIEDSNHLIKIITLSPEYDGAFKAIEFCCKNGIKVAIGHTSATAEQIQRAVDFGADLSTHLGNGSHTTLPRHDNYIWDQLAIEELNCTLISDGVHLPKNVLKCFLKIKKEKAMFISDSSTIAGLKPGYYETHIGGKVLLTEENRLCVAENPKLLAGSAANLFDEINFIYKNKLLSFSDAIRMATVRPGKYLGYNVDLIVGNAANIVAIDKQDELFIKQIWQNGEAIECR